MTFEQHARGTGLDRSGLWAQSGARERLCSMLQCSSWSVACKRMLNKGLMPALCLAVAC
jgi:hypothetical protein